MILELYLLLVAIAVIMTGLVIVVGTTGHIGGVSVDNRTGIVISIATLGLCGLIAISSFDITVYSGGTESSESYPAMAWVAVAMGAVAALSMWKASIEEIRETGGI